MAGKGTPQQKQRDEKRVDELVRAGVAPGKAVQMVAEEYYGSVRGDSGSAAGGTSALHGSVNKDQQYASDELVLGNGSDKARFFTGGVSTQEDANNVLGTIRQTLGESQRADMSYAYASNRLTAKAAAQTAFYNGEVSGIYNVHQATAQRNASFNGFRADLMTQEDWGYTIANQTRQWSQQNATSAMMFVAGVATLPMLAADLLAVGALAGRGAMTLGRGVMNTADDMGRSLYASYQATGIRGTLLSAASPTTSWATVQSASLTAMRGAAARIPSALETRVDVALRAMVQKLPVNSEDLAIAAIGGTLNTSIDYVISGGNMSGMDALKSFVGGAVGAGIGSLSSRLITGRAERMRLSSPVMTGELLGGAIGGAAGEFTSLRFDHSFASIMENPEHWRRIAFAAGAGGLAGGVLYKTSLSWKRGLTPVAFSSTEERASYGTMLGNFGMKAYDGAEAAWQWFATRYGSQP